VLQKERGRSLKGGFGFDPLLAYLDETREALAGVLRPGNAGANTASDHLRVLDLALEQLGQADAAGVVRTDSASATHQFTDELREAHINFVMGYDLTAPVREATDRDDARCLRERQRRTRSSRHQSVRTPPACLPVSRDPGPARGPVRGPILAFLVPVRNRR